MLYRWEMLVILIFADIPTLKDSLMRCYEQEAAWTGWSQNYAALLVDIMGLNDELVGYHTGLK